jgi:RHS repeat-associated protein
MDGRFPGVVASPWLQPAGGTLQLALTNVGTCTFPPGLGGTCTISCDGIPRARSKTGVVAGSYEYRRYESGQTPFWTPLRFPGQYYDAESDLFENWNRYYDPTIGRYLQPEPLAQKPWFATMRAEDALGASAYAYTSNNPLTLYDDNGLHDTNGCKYGSTCGDCAEEAAKIRDDIIRPCVVTKCKGKKVKLLCEEKRKKKDECGPLDPADPNGLRRSAAVRLDEKNRVTWCEDKLTTKCQALLLVHELAHLCGWRDEENPPPGVPQKELQACKVQK